MQQYLPLLIAGAMIVFMFTSGNKRKKAAAQMATKIVPGAKVTLTSGIYAEIVSITDDRAVIISANKTVLEVAKGAITRVIENAPETAEVKAAAKPVVKSAAKPAVKKPAVKKPAAKK
jgi:preprotein translocase subunit YajC